MTREEKERYVRRCCEIFPICSHCTCYDFNFCGTGFENMRDSNIDKLYERMKEYMTIHHIEIEDDSQEVSREVNDNVEHPSHYTNASIECIDAMEETQGKDAVISFCVCNAFKYLWRHNLKNGTEDIKKANWYLNKAVELMEKE